MRGSDWEREALLTLFDKGKILVQQNVGIRIKGNYSRIAPQKSFNIYAKKKYGNSTIETNILEDNYDINGNLITSYKRLSFRAVYDSSRIRDPIGTDLFHSRKDLTTVNHHPSIMFLNGEYWGAYYIQEKLTDDFIEKNYLIKSKDVALIKDNELEEGKEEEVTKFKEFCKEYIKKDLANKEIYEEVKKFIDVNSFIELYAGEIYISNNDWPGKNDGEWRNTGKEIEGNEYSDGKWRFIIFDLDLSMRGGGGGGNRWGGFPSSSFNHALSRIQRAPLNYLFFALIKNNSDFQRKFVNVYCDLANDVYTPKKVNKILNKYREELTNSVADSLLRWARSNSNSNSKLELFSNYRTNYLRSLDSLSNFYEKRANITMPDMKKFLGLKGNLVDLNIEIKGKGKVQINTIIPEINDGKWTGKYFTRIPIPIKAIPDAGYTFKRWSGFIESTKKNEEIILLESQTIIVEFD
jgi:hypothetical protein